MEIYKSIIINYNDIQDFNTKNFEYFVKIIQEAKDKFTNHLFLIVDNLIFDNYSLTTHIIDFTDSIGLFLIDELIWLTNDDIKNSHYQNIFKSVLWLSVKKDYFFNKDLLRVNHIWKDMEWGKREKNYHPLGKDMGNIWLIEESEKAVITQQIFMNLNQLVANCILSQIEKEDESFAIYTNQKQLLQATDIHHIIAQKVEKNFTLKTIEI